MMRDKHINLNNNWGYESKFQKEMLTKEFPETSMEEVRIPHTNVVTPYNYFDETIYQFVSCYRRILKAEQSWNGKHVLLTFEGVAHIAKVYVNEDLVTTHFGGYTAFTVDLAPYLLYGEENVLVVEVDSKEDNNLPPFGNVIDYMTYGGIYREVYIEIKEPVYLEDIFIVTKDIEKQEKTVDLAITLNEEVKDNFIIKYSMNTTDDLEMQRTLSNGTTNLTGKNSNISFTVANASNWEMDSPVLYQLHIELYQGDILIDSKSIRFGLRTCEFKVDGFYLNDKKVKLLGLNRHQSYAYVGYAMPKSMQRRDAEILKEELLVNAVRTSHYPQSQHFIDRCDELGLLVFTEIPGWQHIGDEAWKEIAYNQVKEMILQYRNHPSIILWGVRINESPDDNDFYEKTNLIAHTLDASRQTGGVRFIKKSNLLEDVYTYNDFLHNGSTKGLDAKKDVTPNVKAPYLVSEFNGHMFPTKSFDSEDHRLEHALRHACVIDSLFENDDMAGGFGWCMFDYNTHQDFGSGDRICYHGVMDMFRNHKLAAVVYSSQNDKVPVCEISSSMDIGEHPVGYIGDVYAFTNADSIKVYKKEMFIKEFYPSKTKYNNLPHPPIIIDDFVGDLMEKGEKFSHKTAETIKEVLFAIARYGQSGLPLKYKVKLAVVMLKEKLNVTDGLRLYYDYIGNWGGTVTTYKFKAIKDNKVVKVVEKRPAKAPTLQLIVDSYELREEETYDVAGIRIIAVDENGNRIAYFQEPVILEATGAIELIGPKYVGLKGGAAGTYVKTKGQTGTGELCIYQEQLGRQKLIFQVTSK